MLNYHWDKCFKQRYRVLGECLTGKTWPWQSHQGQLPWGRYIWVESKRTAGKEALGRRNMVGGSNNDQITEIRPMWMLGIEGWGRKMKDGGKKTSI